MPKQVSEAERARCVSLSLTAPEIFILECLVKRELATGGDSTQAYRDAIMSAGARADIHPFVHTSDGAKPTPEFVQFLKERGWHGAQSKNAKSKNQPDSIYATINSSHGNSVREREST